MHTINAIMVMPQSHGEITSLMDNLGGRECNLDHTDGMHLLADYFILLEKAVFYDCGKFQIWRIC